MMEALSSLVTPVRLHGVTSQKTAIFIRINKVDIVRKKEKGRTEPYRFRTIHLLHGKPSYS
jgi:hypothetical protein